MGTECDCKHSGRLWIRFPLKEIFDISIVFALVSKQSGALSSAIQYAMPPKLDGKLGTEYLNTWFRLPTLLYVGMRASRMRREV